MAKAGEDFHRLVECLERALAGRTDVKIEAPKFFEDKITGDQREHDVVLTYQNPHREIVVAIECRDRSRKVGAPQIEEFRTKCNDTGVDKGVIVSSKGFASTALKKAAHYNIDCLLLEEVEKLDWCIMTGITGYRRHLNNPHVTIEPKDTSLQGMSLFEDLKCFHVLSDGSVEEITAANIGNLVANTINSLPPEQVPADRNLVNIKVANTHDFYLVDKKGVRHEVSNVLMNVPYTTEIVETPVRFYNYGKGKADGPAYSTMMAEIDVGPDLKGNLVMVNDNENITISFVPIKS